MIELFVVKKHILERKRQSLVAILGITIGIAVLVISIAISNGLNDNTIKNMLSLSSHIEVLNGMDPIENYRKNQSIITKIKGVKGVVPQIKTKGIIKYNGNKTPYISGVLIDALDIEDAKMGMDLKNKVVEGSLEFKEDTDFLIGKELFDKLGVKVGDKVRLVSANNMSMDMTIVGVFESGYSDYDNNIVIVPLKLGQQLSYGKDVIDQLNIFLENPRDANKIAGIIGSKTEMYTRTWESLNRNFLAALNLEKTVMTLIFSLLVLLAGFVVWIIMSMMVREKIKDIGILKSMGFTSKNIMTIFTLEGLFLGVFGILMGLILSVGVLLFLDSDNLLGIAKIYHLSKIPTKISMKEILVIVGANIVIIFLSSVFPAYHASKLKIVDALKHD